jgi:hypothetical protein
MQQTAIVNYALLRYSYFFPIPGGPLIAWLPGYLLTFSHLPSNLNKSPLHCSSLFQIHPRADFALFPYCPSSPIIS